jgi:sugar phosphate isomerase/epimerase
LLVEITVRGPAYHSLHDEAAMFEWLAKMTFLEVEGSGSDLILRLARGPSDDELRDLLAIFKRYGLDMRALAALRTSDNERWFASPKSIGLLMSLGCVRANGPGPFRRTIVPDDLPGEGHLKLIACSSTR